LAKTSKEKAEAEKRVAIAEAKLSDLGKKK
jgi:hypothetical protein